MGAVQEMRRRLATYAELHIEFNEPHFTTQLLLRDGDLRDVISNLLHPVKLVHCSTQAGTHGSTKHVLYFQVSNTRTMVLPVIFDRHGERSIYILTYIMRYRRWHR